MLIYGWLDSVGLSQIHGNQGAAALMRSHSCGEANMPELPDWFDPGVKTGPEPKEKNHLPTHMKTPGSMCVFPMRSQDPLLIVMRDEGDILEVPSFSTIF